LRLPPFLRLFVFGMVLLAFNLTLFYLMGHGKEKEILEAAGWMGRPEGALLLSEWRVGFLWVLAGTGLMSALFVGVLSKVWPSEKPLNLTESDWRDFEKARFERRSTALSAPKDIFIPGRNFNEMLGRLGDQDSLLLTMIHSMNEGVLLLNEAGRIVLLNPSARRILDVTEEAAMGHHYLEVVRHAGLAELIGRSQGGEALAHGELELSGGEERTFSVNVGAVRDDSGRVLGQIMVFADISGLKRLMKMRSDFVANVSHELKTPLTAILGYVETLQAGAMDDKKNRAQFLSKIGDQSRRLHDLIEDVLELSAIESGRYLEAVTEVDVQTAVDAAKEDVLAKAATKKIGLVDVVPGDLRVKAQKNGLQRILVNLLDNAVKYSPENTTVNVSAQVEMNGSVSIRVADEGCGIPQEHLSRIFERFYRVDVSRSRAAGGTGLGLAIVKHLTERVGGTVVVESIEGKGSTFTVTLPSA
jgi:two-component system phosphate regulon sensor histidine kinase PhoR